jgi:addiction module RelE/StbE family toxin
MLRRIVRKNSKLADIIDDRIEMLKNNPQDKPLKLHKLTGKGKDKWSISINRNIRLLFQYTDDGILLTDIGTHDEVY